MSDELLHFYNRELQFIRQQGLDFAATHPKIAGRLHLGPDVPQDPHVARLIEAFAFLNARTRLKLEDDFPEITEAYFNVLYPHYMAPIPSMAVVQFALERGQSEMVDGYRIERHRELDTEPIEGQPCRFRTCYPVHLWPLRVTEASLERRPFRAPQRSTTSAPDVDPQAVLRIRLDSFSSEVPIGAFAFERLRFFIHGQAPDVFDLYELLFRNIVDVVVATSQRDDAAVVLPPTSLRPVGFERDEGMLHYPARSFLGYRLLSEFFAFPQKFLFFDVELDRRSVERLKGNLELVFFLKEGNIDLERTVTADSFRLGCTPIVNLYRHSAESLQLTHAQTEYRAVPDWRRPMAHEIYSIDSVVATSPDGEAVPYEPFYSFQHARTGREKTFWYAARRPAPERPKEIDRGTEVFLSFVDLDFRTAPPSDWTINIESTCLNRDQPRRLPFGGGQPYLQLAAGAPPLDPIQCLTRPTRTLRPAMGHGTRWRLISHLALNHLSLVDYADDATGRAGADALREILRLYDYSDAPEIRDVIAGVRGVSSRRVTSRIRHPVDGKETTFLCRGMEVTLDFDEAKFSGGGLFLLASVLDRFLALYCSINSFVRTIAVTDQGVLHQWPPRAGEQVLL